MKRGESLWEKRPLSAAGRERWLTNVANERYIFLLPEREPLKIRLTTRANNGLPRLPVSLPNSFSHESLELFPFSLPPPPPLPRKEAREVHNAGRSLLVISKWEIFSPRVCFPEKNCPIFGAPGFYDGIKQAPPSSTLQRVSFRDRGDKKKGFALMCPAEWKRSVPRRSPF